MGEWEKRNLINELTQGREAARQLLVHLNVPSPSPETSDLLVQKIQASYEKALSLLNCNNTSSSQAADQPQPSSALAIRMSESPPSRSGSPRSEDSDRDFKEQELKDASRKRKTQPRWTQLVRFTPGITLEGALDDGFSWRKYGQKDILGAKYPRGYYRCTHRNVQDCLATKQVQRSDDDPTIFEITYRGSHTCNLASRFMHSSGPSGNRQQGINTEPQQHNQQLQQNQTQPQDLLLSFQRGPKVITQDLDIIREHTYPPSTSNIKVEKDDVFTPSVVANLSPAFTTSGTNYFSNLSTSPSPMNSHVQGTINFETSDHPQLTEIIQAPTSATDSCTVGLDFPSGNAAEFDPNFMFDNHGFFSS